MLYQTEVVYLFNFKIALVITMEYCVRPSEEILFLLAKSAQLEAGLELV